MSPGPQRRNHESGGLALEAVEVHKFFEQDRVTALDGVTMAVAAGEWVSLFGPSGAGKSTLLYLFAGLDVPSIGTILVGGQNLARRRHLATYRRLEVGLVFQLHNLLAHLDASRNVEIAMFGTDRSRTERRTRAGEMLELLGLASQVGRKPAGGGVLATAALLSRRVLAFSIAPTRLLLVVFFMVGPVVLSLLALLAKPSRIIRSRK